jgi:SAM-dependent methyltransferase
MPYSDARGRGRLGQAYHLARYKLAYRHAFADVKYRSFSRIRAMVERELGSVSGKKLLEIGSGQWRTNILLFAALGADILGVDPESPPDGILEYLAYARSVGWQRAVKTAMSEAMLGGRFRRRLAELSGLPIPDARGRVHRGEAERLPLDDTSVDAVFSDDVFEHLRDVEAVTAEMRRVLKPGAPAVVIIHPFTAYSGGHHPATIDHGSGQHGAIPPWDHLRERRHPAGVYLNGLRCADYRSILERHLEIVDWDIPAREGEAYLTSEVLADLEARGYRRDELLIGKIICLARRPAGTASPVDEAMSGPGADAAGLAARRDTRRSA